VAIRRVQYLHIGDVVAGVQRVSVVHYDPNQRVAYRYVFATLEVSQARSTGRASGRRRRYRCVHWFRGHSLSIVACTTASRGRGASFMDMSRRRVAVAGKVEVLREGHVLVHLTRTRSERKTLQLDDQSDRSL